MRAPVDVRRSSHRLSPIHSQLAFLTIRHHGAVANFMNISEIRADFGLTLFKQDQNLAAPRPLFLYGTLRAPPLLACVLTGDESNITEIQALVEPGTTIIAGFSRVSVVGKDFPALIRSSRSSMVDGILLRPLTHSHRRRIKDFVGSYYTITPVTVFVDKKGTRTRVEADVYVWNGDLELESKPWDLETFIRDKLESWLEIFSGIGIELVG